MVACDARSVVSAKRKVQSRLLMMEGVVVVVVDLRRMNQGSFVLVVNLWCGGQRGEKVD